LTISNVEQSDEGNYSVVVSDLLGSLISSNATLTVVYPPTLWKYPLPGVVPLAGKFSFNVEVNGTPPFLYQWRFRSDNIPGATNNAYVIESVSATNSGIYSIVVSNWAGTTNASADLTVVLPPVIAAQPTNLVVSPGSAATFAVSVTGTPPFWYQWRFNDTNLLNANGPAFTIAAVRARDAGNYSVVISNRFWRITSSNTTLDVTKFAPKLSLKLSADYPSLALHGMYGENFLVQYSTNLAPGGWMNLLSLTNLSSDPYLFLDPSGDSDHFRFYRALTK
jgi:hypothetical protein